MPRACRPSGTDVACDDASARGRRVSHGPRVKEQQGGGQAEEGGRRGEREGAEGQGTGEGGRAEALCARSR
eukprot:362713-Chlamydomonas_euryale.AAC.14